MARTTSELVEGIIDVESGIDLTPFISAANNLVTQFCTGSAVTTAYSTEAIQEIETWLAANFYAIYDPRAVTEKAGDVAAKYQSKVDLGLSVTHYGQMAMTLDWNGGLAGHNGMVLKGKTGGVRAIWLGTEEE